MSAKAIEQLQGSLKATDRSALDAVAAALKMSSSFDILKQDADKLELSLKQVNKEFTLLASVSLEKTEKELSRAEKAVKSFEDVLDKMGKFNKALTDVTGAAKDLAKAYEPFSKEGSKAVQGAIGDLEKFIATAQKIAEITGLVWALVKAAKALGPALAANPFGALVAGLITAGAAIDFLITKMKESDQAFLDQTAKANELAGTYFKLAQAKGFVAEEDIKAGRKGLEQLENDRKKLSEQVAAASEELRKKEQELARVRADDTPSFGGGFVGLTRRDTQEIGLLGGISRDKEALEKLELQLDETSGRIFFMQRALDNVKGKPQAAADEIEALTQKLKELFATLGRQEAFLGRFREMLQGQDLGLGGVGDVDLLQSAFGRVNQLDFDPGQLSRMLEMVRSALADGGGAAEVEALLSAFEKMSELQVGLGTDEGQRILRESEAYATQRVEVDALLESLRGQIQVRQELLPVMEAQARLTASLGQAFQAGGADFDGFAFLGDALGSLGDLDASGQVEVLRQLVAQVREIDPAAEHVRALAEAMDQLTGASDDPGQQADALRLLIEQAEKGQLGAEQIRALASALAELDNLGSGISPEDLDSLLQLIQAQASATEKIEAARQALEEKIAVEREAARVAEEHRQAREEMIPALELERDLLKKLSAELDKGEEAASGLKFLADAFKDLAASEILPEDKLRIFDKLISQVGETDLASEQISALAESFRLLAQSDASPEQQISALQRLLEAASAGDVAAAQIRSLAKALLMLGNIDPDSETGQQILDLADQVGETLGEIEGKSEETTQAVNKHWQGFVDGVSSQFKSALSELFKGSTDGFESLFENIGDMFADMLADMVTQWLKAKIFQQGSGPDFGSFGQQFNTNPASAASNPGVGGAAYANAAFAGAGIGSVVGGSVVGGDPTVSAIFGAAGAAVGMKIGMSIGAAGGPIGMFIGAILGGLIGGLLSKKPTPRGYADLALRDGMVVIESLRTRGKANVEQLKKFAKGAAEAVNELAQLTGGTLVSIPDISLETKKNKWFRVIDESGIVHKFGEDMEAAIDYAVTQILKNAEFEGLSPEVEAALQNTRASTVDEFKSDIEFATTIRDIDLDPVTKDLRQLMEGFNGMRDRARQLGISLDKVDTAFSKAVNDLKENILEDLKPFEEMGLTDVEREARRISEAFDEMRENARRFNEELTNEKNARNDEIAALEQQLEQQERLQEQYENLAGLDIDFPEMDFDEEFGIGRGFNPPDFGQMAENAGEEIARLMEEIGRLMQLNAEQQLIDLERIEEAERQARAALRERVRDSLDQYRFSNLTPVQQQLRQLSSTFEKLRRDARAAGVGMGEVNSALSAAREAIRQQVLDRLQPYEDTAQGLSPLEIELRNVQQIFEDLRTDAAELGISLERVDAAFEAAVANLRERLGDELQGYHDQTENPVIVQLRQLDERFAELRRSAEALGVSLEEVDAAYEAAVAALRQQVEAELQGFADAGANPFVVELRNLQDRFEELRESAETLGIATEEVSAAYNAALAAQQDQLRDGLQGFLDYGAGLTDLEISHRDLTDFFAEQIEAARALDEAMGTLGAGGGPGENEQLVLDAQAAAFQQLIDEFNASLRDLRDAGLSPMEIALRDIRERFTELRANAELLGVSVDGLTRLEQAAINRLKDDLQSSLDQYLLSDEERGEKALEEEFLGYLADALNLFGAESGDLIGAAEEEEPFPAASKLEASFLSIVQVATELQQAFQGVAQSMIDKERGMPVLMAKPLTLMPGKPIPGLPFPGIPLPKPVPELPKAPEASASETVLAAVDRLQEILSGRGLEDLSPVASNEISTAAADLNVLLEQLRLGVSDDIPAVEAALGDFVTLLRDNGLEVGDSLLNLTDALASSDVGTFLQELADQSLLTGEGFGALLDALLSGDLSLPDLMNDLANGVFDSVQALLGLSEIPEDLAAMLQDIGLAFDQAERQQRPAPRGRTSGSSAEQVAREREALENQLEQYEDLALSPTERELKRINEQFDEMRESAKRLGIPLSRVEAAYELAIQQQRDFLIDQLEPFEEIGMSPVALELKRLDEQFDELRASAALLGVSQERVEAAYQAAVEQQREAVLEQLKPFEEIGMSPVALELKRLDEQFEQLREDAALLGISQERLDEAYEAAVDNQREIFLEQLKPFEELGLSPVALELQRLDEQFEQLREDADLLGISQERLDEAYAAAIEHQRDNFLAQLKPFEEIGLSPVALELQRLDEQFNQLREDAELLGISQERVEEAYEAAIEQQREAFFEQLKPFEEIGLSPLELELKRLDEQFEQLREDAELLGISQKRVEEAYEAAIQHQKDALAEQLRPFEELGMSAGERELAQLNEQFEEIRANAELLGFSIERVEEAYAAAIEDFWERTLQPIRDFQDSLLLSQDSPLTPEERLGEAQRRFDEMAAAALAGDFDAIQELPNLAQGLLDEAQGFFASGQGYQDIFALVQEVLDGVLANTPNTDELVEQLGDGAEPVKDGAFEILDQADESLRHMTTVIDEDLRKVSDSFDGLMMTTGRGVMELTRAIDRNILRVVDETGGCTEKLIREVEGGFTRPFLSDGIFSDEDQRPYLKGAYEIFAPGRPVRPAYPTLARPAEPTEPVFQVDMKLEDSAVVDELRLSRQASHADASVLHADSVEMHKKLEDQAVEIRELRALMRRMTSRVEFGRRV